MRRWLLSIIALLVLVSALPAFAEDADGVIETARPAADEVFGVESFHTSDHGEGIELAQVFVIPTKWPRVAPGLSETANFLPKTRIGFGGFQSANLSQSGLAAEGASCFTSLKDASGTAAPIFTCDERGFIVPKNGSGTYGQQWVTSLNSPLTGVLYDGTNTETITITVSGNGATVRENTGSADGCTTLCPATAHSDYTFRDTQNLPGGQPIYMLDMRTSDAGYLVGGDVIVARNGYWNPTDEDYEVNGPNGAATQWSGRIVLKSEHPDTVDGTYSTALNLDANGNPRLQNGFEIGWWQDYYGQNAYYPVQLQYVWFHRNSTAKIGGRGLAYLWGTHGPGWNNGVTYSRADFDPGFTNALVQGVLVSYGGGNTVNVIDHNHVVETSTMGGGAAVVINNGEGGTATPGAQVTWNICESMVDDCIDVDGVVAGPTIVKWNTAFNWGYLSGNHQDCYQNLGNQANTSVDLGEIAYNFCVRGNVGINAPDAQGFPFMSEYSSTTNTWTNASVHNNINNMTYANGLAVSNALNPNVYANTVLSAQGTDNTSAVAATLSLVNDTGGGGSGGTLSNNLTNTISVGSQPGTVTQTDNVVLSFTGSYTSCLPNYVAGENANLHNRAQIIAFFTPSLNGSCKNSDGTYGGALNPPDSSGVTSYVTPGSAFVYTATHTPAT